MRLNIFQPQKDSVKIIMALVLAYIIRQIGTKIIVSMSVSPQKIGLRLS
jgi:hypothetical protein